MRDFVKYIIGIIAMIVLFYIIDSCCRHHYSDKMPRYVFVDATNTMHLLARCDSIPKANGIRGVIDILQFDEAWVLFDAVEQPYCARCVSEADIKDMKKAAKESMLQDVMED